MYRQPQSPSSRHSLGRDETHLPQGECRYLLLIPHTRRERCACVGFSLNRSTPGSSCDCGHQACYHLPLKDDRIAERAEIVELRQKVQRLEELLEHERSGIKHSLTSRLSALEELVDRYKADVDSEVKTAYKGLEGLWHNVGVLQRQARSHDDRIDALIDANQATQDDLQSLQSRIIEVDDASMILEERVDSLVSYDSRNIRPNRTASLPLTKSPKIELSVTEPQSASGDTSRAWTVHVSLLPKASQPFPFEKDTRAYRRALSRGLHRVITIHGMDNQSFTEGISSGFAPLLQGRPWMPLVAKICDAQTLQGLPMLRQLPSAKIDESFYSYDFLKNNCATVDSDGHICDLYIAMRHDTFSWAELQQSPVVVANLEACWEYDTILDSASRLDDETHSHKDESEEKPKPEEKPSAGDLLRAWSPPATRLKRKAAALSRKSSFGSIDGDSNAKRTKTLPQRLPPATAVEVNSR